MKNLTVEEKTGFKIAEVYNINENEFKLINIRVKSHDHLIEKYRVLLIYT